LLGAGTTRLDASSGVGSVNPALRLASTIGFIAPSAANALETATIEPARAVARASARAKAENRDI